MYSIIMDEREKFIEIYQNPETPTTTLACG